MRLRPAPDEPDGGLPSTTYRSHEVVDAALLRCFAQLARQLGGDPDPLLRAARIDPAVLDNSRSMIEFASLARLMEAGSRELSCPDFGLRLAALQGGTIAISPIGVILKNSTTFGQAIQYGSKFVRANSLPARFRVEHDRSSDRLFVEIDTAIAGVSSSQQLAEYAIMLGRLNILEITDGAVQPTKITFRHRPQSALARYRDYFCCDVAFGEPADGLSLRLRDLEQPLRNPDARVHEMAISYLETRYSGSQSALRDRVRNMIRATLGADDCTSERIAAALCLHRRTLQRRLSAEGTSFEALKDEIRRDLALQALGEEGMSLTLLAEKLGYAETSVLTRSFGRWFAATPTEMRKKLRPPDVEQPAH
jgi:AraC-like DNA-binding protein